jgi:hypothetical protein
VQRRTFLVESSRAALGLSALACSACASPTQNAPVDPFLGSLVAHYGAAAMLMTTPTDYAKFLLEFLRKPADDFRLNHASRNEMPRPQFTNNDRAWEGLAMLADPAGPSATPQTIWPAFAKRFFAVL